MFGILILILNYEIYLFIYIKMGIFNISYNLIMVVLSLIQFINFIQMLIGK